MIQAIQKRILAADAPNPAEIFVCDACCCGDARFTERDDMPELQLSLAEALESGRAARACPAYTTDCMGPCEIGNNVILAGRKQNLFFCGMNKKADMDALGRWVAQWIKNPSQPLPQVLKGKLKDAKKL